MPARRFASLWKLFALGVMLLLSGSAAAQDAPSYVVREWNEHDGLPVKRLVNGALLQTRDGYLWIGTRAGLVRFDGLRFETFTTDNTQGLPDNRIGHLFESRDGSLWIATYYGYLVRYKNRSFTPLISDAASTPNPAYVTSFFEEADGTLWIGSTAGVFRFQDETLSKYLPNAINTSVEDLLVDGKGALWIAAGDNGLLRVRADTVVQYTTSDGLADSFVSNVELSDDGTIWAQHPKGTLSHFSQRNLSSFSLPGSSPLDLHFLYKDLQERLWLSVDDQLYHLLGGQWQPVAFGESLAGLVPEWFSWEHTQIGKDLARSWYTWQFAQVGEMVPDAIAPPPPASTRDGLRQNKSQQMMRDSENNVWFAGVDRGLIRLRPALFNTVLDEHNVDVTDADAREELNIFAIAESRDGSMWFGGLLTTLTQRLPDGQFIHYGKPDAFSFPSWAILEDRAGNLWVNGALCQRNKDATCSSFQPVEPLQSRLVAAIAEDRKGNMWFGTSDGLFRLVPGPNPSDPLQGTWTHFTEEDGLSHRRIQVIHEGRDGALWIGTNNGGIVRYQNNSENNSENDGANDRFTQLTVAHGLPGNRISALYEDDRGVLWAGTEDLGLARIQFDRNTYPNFDSLNTRITVYRKENGLYNNGVHAILEDDQERFWMSTKYGIFWVEREALDAYAAGSLPRIPSTAYTSSDGLIDQETNSGSGHAGIRARDGRLWFATQAGAAVVNPVDVQLNQIPPPVVIESAWTQDQQVSIQDGRIALAPERRDIEITYTGLSLGVPDLVRFSYKLEGYDETWIEAGTRRSAHYTKVPAGEYNFRVRAANNDGVWNQQGAALSVFMTPFFYETGWFRLLSLLALVGALIFMDRLRVRNLVQRKQELKQIVAERTQALRAEKDKTEQQAQRLLELGRQKNHFYENISHEFRTPLTLIIGPLQQLLSGGDRSRPKSLRRYHLMMLRNSRRLLRLINQILDLARVDSGQLQLKKETQDVASLLKEAVRVFIPLAERRGITLAFQAARHNENTPVTCKISYDRDKLSNVISNLLSNALKFTPEGGRVTVYLRDTVNTVEIEVEDTGQGIPSHMLDNIFNRFSQLESDKHHFQEGSGIGLSIVKEFVELHKGSVSVRSELGAGSSFTVQLPKLDRDEPDTEVRHNVTSIKQTHPAPDEDWLVLEPDLLAIQDAVPPDNTSDEDDRVTVLVVDDNAEVRLFIRSILENNYRVLEANDGVEGLKKARKALPDLIVADIMMPNMDGLTFNRKLKQAPDTACVPVILLSAKAAPEDQIAGLETSVDAYVTKPFEPSVLVARVKALLTIRHRLRDQMVRERQEHTNEKNKDAAPHLMPLHEKVRQVILQNLENTDFSVDLLADSMTMSRWQLRRRLGEELGMTPTLFIRKVRLDMAAEILSKRSGNVSEVAFAVGFQSLSHFTRSFRAQFGVTPSAYLEGKRSQEAEA